MFVKKLYLLSTFLFLLTACPILVYGQKPAAERKPRTLLCLEIPGAHDVKKEFGAKGDGKALDSPAINRAIAFAVQAGPGTICLPAGTYLSVSIHLESNLTWYFEEGAKIVAADPMKDEGRYDPPESNSWDKYQDFGHSHWHNSLIWGENLENITLTGPGMIWGRGLVAYGSQSRTREQNDALRNSPFPSSAVAPFGYPNARDAVETGWANKTIALKNCRNVKIEGLIILHGGHIAILATGVDDLTLNDLTIDTNRDGIDIDSCRRVIITDVRVNAPLDDALCLKSSYALGFARATEDVTIDRAYVSGYDEGTFLDGTLKRTDSNVLGSPTGGRIKLGTESNGGFKNIKILNSTCDYCRGVAIEEVDGGVSENITIDHLTMINVTTAPLFIRLGSRNRGPQGQTTIGALRHIVINDVVAKDVNYQYAIIISGIPGHPVEDVKLSNFNIVYQGGGIQEQAALEPPEKETDYPEPTMFGEMPAYALFARHVNGLTADNIDVSCIIEDARAPFILNDVTGADFNRLKAQHVANVPTFIFKDIQNFNLHQSPPLADNLIKSAQAGKL